MDIVERFLKYTSFDTQSNETSGVTPSTPGQMTFAKYLKRETECFYQVLSILRVMPHIKEFSLH